MESIVLVPLPPASKSWESDDPMLLLSTAMSGQFCSSIFTLYGAEYTVLKGDSLD